MRSYDREDLKPKVERRQTMLLVDQVANAMLALKMREEARVGTVNIPTCALALYSAIAATQVTPFVANLPVVPMQLDMDMGVWSIKSSAGLAYIPIRTEFWDLMAAQDEGLLEDQVGFFVRGRKVYFTRIPTATVDMELLIVDPALLGEYDPYPIPADMEILVVQRVVELLKSSPLAPDKPVG